MKLAEQLLQCMTLVAFGRENEEGEHEKVTEVKMLYDTKHGAFEIIVRRPKKSSKSKDGK